MAVTTTKTNIMTIIEEDGGDPTGAGGKVINKTDGFVVRGQVRRP